MRLYTLPVSQVGVTSFPTRPHWAFFTLFNTFLTFHFSIKASDTVIHHTSWCLILLLFIHGVDKLTTDLENSAQKDITWVSVEILVVSSYIFFTDPSDGFTPVFSDHNREPNSKKDWWIDENRNIQIYSNSDLRIHMVLHYFLFLLDIKSNTTDDTSVSFLINAANCVCGRWLWSQRWLWLVFLFSSFFPSLLLVLSQLISFSLLMSLSSSAQSN